MEMQDVTVIPPQPTRKPIEAGPGDDCDCEGCELRRSHGVTLTEHAVAMHPVLAVLPPDALAIIRDVRGGPEDFPDLDTRPDLCAALDACYRDTRRILDTMPAAKAAGVKRADWMAEHDAEIERISNAVCEAFDFNQAHALHAQHLVQLRITFEDNNIDLDRLDADIAASLAEMGDV